jgi:hypothetical protein
MTSGFRFGFMPRRFVGMSGSNGAHCRSLIQNSFVDHVRFGRFEYEIRYSECDGVERIDCAPVLGNGVQSVQHRRRERDSLQQKRQPDRDVTKPDLRYGKQ